MKPVQIPKIPSQPARIPIAWLIAGTVIFVFNWGMIRVGAWTAGMSDSVQLFALTAIYSASGIFLLASMAWLWWSNSDRRIIIWIFAAGLAMRLLAFTEPPRFESDFHRYLWDGAVTASGHNPYGILPRDILEHRTDRLPPDAAFESLTRDARLTISSINHPYLTTIYPPIAQGFFALAYWIRPFDTEALRAVFLAAELALICLLLGMLRYLGLPLHWIAIYWWNPIAVKEFYVSAHMDALSALFAVAATSAVILRWRRTGIVLLGMAVGVKLWPIILAPILVRYGAKSWRQVFSATFLLAIVAGILTWPLLASWGQESQSGVNAYAHQWINNAGLFSVIHWTAQSLYHAGLAWWPDAHQFARKVTVGLVVVWVLILANRKLPDAAAVSRWCMLAVSVLFLLSPTQFPWYYTWLLPFLVLAPSRAMLLYTALLPLYHLHYAHPWVLAIEHIPIWLMIGFDLRRWRRARYQQIPGRSEYPPYIPRSDLRIAVIIPALNEEHAIGHVLRSIPKWVCQIILVDNGSTDRTAEVGKQWEATVVHEPQRGYGAACLAGIALLDHPDIVVFLDGDFSDHPEEMSLLIEPIARDDADLVIGSRVLGHSERGALTPQQRFGNSLACWLIRVLYGIRFSDLGPFRAIRYSSLERLEMDDRDFGWTVQMQVRSARRGLRSTEVAVSYRRRIGQSKISGTVRGVVAAGTKIMSTILREGLGPNPRNALKQSERLIIFARYPEPGKAKTRMIPLLGAKGAALLHRQLVRGTIELARQLQSRRKVQIDVRFTGATRRNMASLFGNDFSYYEQCEGDLGKRLRHGAAEALASGASRIVLVGTDCPLLSAGRLCEAFTALDTNDVVIGPATDGGYYLIGMKSIHPSLFDDIAWGGPDVLMQTRAACQKLGLSHVLLAELSDIDTPKDLGVWASTKFAPPDILPSVSVIIPVLNEQDHLAATIASVLTANNVEIIVVDGQSTDRTIDIARQFGAIIVDSQPSRGLQSNAGAQIARSDVLLFLHGDTTLPPSFVTGIRQALGYSDVSAGAMELAIDAEGLPPRLIEWGVRIRSKLFGRPYGDQAFFMRAQTWHDCGGYPATESMEDYAMLSRLKAHGRIVIAPQRALTSARKWQVRGWLRTTLLHQQMLLQHHFRQAFPSDSQRIH